MRGHNIITYVLREIWELNPKLSLLLLLFWSMTMLKTETDILAMGFYVQTDKIQNQMVVIDNLLLEGSFVIRASFFIGHR